MRRLFIPMATRNYGASGVVFGKRSKQRSNLVSEGDYQEEILKRIVVFLRNLKLARMRREDSALQGYSFTLTYLRSLAEYSVRAGEPIPNAMDCDLMERSARFLAQAMMQ